MRRPHKEVKIPNVRLYRHLVDQVTLRKDHHTLSQVHLNVDRISSKKLPSLE